MTAQRSNQTMPFRTRSRRATTLVAALAALALMLPLLPSAHAATVTVGDLATPDANIFPFGAKVTGPGNRYQQVYNNNLFTMPEPFIIETITFFGSSGLFQSRDFELRLSTTPTAVNDLDTSNMDNNLGPDDSHFMTQSLFGVVPSEFSFTGTPFLYDPSLGNLLLEILVTPDSIPPTSNMAAVLSMGGTFGDDSSRAHNFGTRFESFGLVTRFEGTVVPTPSAALGGLLMLAAVLLSGRSPRRRPQMPGATP